MATPGRVLLVGLPADLRLGIEAALAPDHRVHVVDNAEAAKDVLREDLDVIVVDDQQTTFRALLSLARRTNPSTLALILTDAPARPEVDGDDSPTLLDRAVRKPVALPRLAALVLSSIAARR